MFMVIFTMGGVIIPKGISPGEFKLRNGTKISIESVVDSTIIIGDLGRIGLDFLRVGLDRLKSLNNLGFQKYEVHSVAVERRGEDPLLMFLTKTGKFERELDLQYNGQQFTADFGDFLDTLYDVYGSCWLINKDLQRAKEGEPNSNATYWGHSDPGIARRQQYIKEQIAMARQTGIRLIQEPIAYLPRARVL